MILVLQMEEELDMRSAILPDLIKARIKCGWAADLAKAAEAERTTVSEIVRPSKCALLARPR